MTNLFLVKPASICATFLFFDSLSVSFVKCSCLPFRIFILSATLVFIAFSQATPTSCALTCYLRLRLRLPMRSWTVLSSLGRFSLVSRLQHSPSGP